MINLKKLLLCSLACNGILAGVIIGHTAHPKAPFEVIKRQEHAVIKQLPPEKAEFFSQTMDAMRTQQKVRRPKIEQARKELMDILSAPEFDREAFDKKARELEILHQQMRRDFADATKTMAGKFTQGERKILAEHIRKVTPPPPPSAR